jgi:S1-C subfamily serine protease
MVNGCDSLSVILNPAFIDPAKGDFRLTPEGLQNAEGFRNFPMDQFGVKKPSLKRIAKVPDVPELKIKLGEHIKASRIKASWYGTMLTEPNGNELSAYGVSLGEEGIGLEDIPAGSKTGKWGYKKGDLLLSVNGYKLSRIGMLANYISSQGQGLSHRFILIRDQQTMTIIVSEPLESIR